MPWSVTTCWWAKPVSWLQCSPNKMPTVKQISRRHWMTYCIQFNTSLYYRLKLLLVNNNITDIVHKIQILFNNYQSKVNRWHRFNFYAFTFTFWFCIAGLWTSIDCKTSQCCVQCTWDLFNLSKSHGSAHPQFLLKRHLNVQEAYKSSLKWLTN